jgi:hypothetical protein
MSNDNGIKVINTDPPSLDVVIYDTINDEAIGKVTVSPGDDALPRIDVIFELRGEFGGIKGEPSIWPPEVPSLPKDASGVAKINVVSGATLIQANNITSWYENDDKTVEQAVPDAPIISGETVALGSVPWADGDLISGPIVVGDGLALNPNDPFEGPLANLVMLQRMKRADYASDDNPFKNFDANAAALGLPNYTALEDCKSMVFRKLGRINNLRGRDPRNETVEDSYQDLVVYAILMLGLYYRDGR